jgi:hypothetical protein
MADRYVFADEAGNFDFSVKSGASKYFTLTTVTMDDCAVGDDLLQLRRDLGWRGLHLDRVPHATEDPPRIRSEVYQLLMKSSFRTDATVLEKRKTQPHLQSRTALYQMAWYLHFKHVAPQIVTSQDRLFVVAASIGTKKTRGQFQSAVQSVVQQVSPCRRYRVGFWPSASDPCLWVADYCTWAVQRQWETNDPSYLNQLSSKLYSNFDVWAPGKKYYY